MINKVTLSHIALVSQKWLITRTETKNPMNSLLKILNQPSGNFIVYSCDTKSENENELTVSISDGDDVWSGSIDSSCRPQSSTVDAGSYIASVKMALNCDNDVKYDRCIQIISTGEIELLIKV